MKKKVKEKKGVQPTQDMTLVNVSYVDGGIMDSTYFYRDSEMYRTNLDDDNDDFPTVL